MATLIALALFQDSIYEAKYKHQKDLLAIPGVKTVSVGGVDGTMAIVVTVENDAAADAVTAKYGESIDGHRLHLIVSGGRKTERKTTAEPGKKPTVPTTSSIPGTLRDYSIPFFPDPKPPTTTEPTPEEQALIDSLLPKPRKTETKTPAATTTTTESGPSRSRTTTTTSGPTRTTTTTSTDGPRWNRPTTTTTGPTRHWTPSGGNTVTRSPGGVPT